MAARYRACIRAAHGLLLGRLDNSFFFVIAAMGANAMRHAQFVAVWTLGEGSRCQMIMRPAAIPPCL